MLKSLKPKSVIICSLLLLVGAIGLDQVTKYHAKAFRMVWSHESDLDLYQGSRYPVWFSGPESDSLRSKPYVYFGFNYVRNQGAAWGMLHDLNDKIRIPFFYMVTFIAVIAIFLYFQSTPPHHLLARFALVLVLSGAVGNFLDRIILGYVIDWIDVSWNIFGWAYDFPKFNIADSCISVGIALLIIDMLFLEPKREGVSAKKA